MRSEATGTVSYVTDAVSSHLALANDAGVISTEYTYEPFGAATSTGMQSRNAFQFTGRENDGIGLDYHRARYYDPASSRFVSEDPLGLRAGINLYRYVDDNPITYTDPFGLEVLMCTAPLESLAPLPSWPRWIGGGGARSGPDIWGNPLYHQFVCVNQNGRIVCGGQTRSGRLWSPGTATHDDPTNPRAHCRQIAPDDRCLERCFLNGLAGPRPSYGPFGPGVSCQEWADRTLVRCLQACGR
jgi:RHS repeat-associated protein